MYKPISNDLYYSFTNGRIVLSDIYQNIMRD